MKKSSLFTITKLQNHLSIICASTLENIDLADEETRLFLTDKGLASSIFAVCLAMREGMTNAVKHGHRLDRDKLVRYSLVVLEKQLIVEIEDEGDGFDWRTIQKRQPILECDHGRGLAIIQKYCKMFWYNEKGNKLVFSIDLNPVCNSI